MAKKRKRKTQKTKEILQENLKTNAVESVPDASQPQPVFHQTAWHVAGMFILFTLAGWLLYSHILQAPFVFDDDRIITENVHLRMNELNWESVAQILKGKGANRPLAMFSFALNYYIDQYNPIGYHLVNIIIHIFTGVLLYGILNITLRLSGEYPSHVSNVKSTPGWLLAAIIGLVWFVHPIQTNAVTYIVQRMASMAAMCYLLALFAYMKGRLAHSSQSRWLWFVLCALAGIAALGCKENAATLPVFLFLYEWFFFQNLSKTWIKRRLPVVVGAGILCILIALFWLGANPLEIILRDYKYKPFTVLERLLTEGRVVIYYISLLFYPHPARLNLDYDFPLSHSLFDPITTIFALGTIATLLIVAGVFAKKERLLSFCILWYLGQLVIESSVLGLDLVFEHRVYLPSMFFFVPFVIFGFRYIRHTQFVLVGLLGISLIFGFWTFQRNTVWKDPFTLWEDNAQKSPNKARPLSSFCYQLYKKGRFAEAIESCSKALAINPNFADAHLNLGISFVKVGKLHQAIEHYKHVIRINPNYIKVYNNLGTALARQGKIKEATSYFMKALELAPYYAEAHYNLGQALLIQKNYESAITHLREALQIQPDFSSARDLLQEVLKAQRRR